MRRYFIAVLMLTLAGCSRPAAPPVAPPAPPAVAPAPEPSPPAPALTVVTPSLPPLPEPPQSLPEGFPNKPFWGEPGTIVEGDDGSVLSKSYATIPFGRVTLHPVEVVTGVDHFFAQAGDGLQLNGTLYHFNGYLSLQDIPAPLGAVPYALARFQPHNGFATGIAGFETVATLAGKFPAVVFQNEDGLQWWSPGVGLVQYQTSSGTTVKATRVLQAKPEQHSQVVTYANGTTAILTLDGIYSQDGTRQVTFTHDAKRVSTRWVDIGAGAPVASHGEFNQVFPHWRQEYYVYRQASGKFQQVVWRFPDGKVRTQVVGSVEQQGNSVYLNDAQDYPEPRYRFEWSGGELKAVEKTVFVPETEERFVRLLTYPLLPEVWTALFTDPEVGRQAYGQVMKNGRNQLAEIQPDWDTDGAWVLKHPGMGLGVRFTLIGTGPDWRVSSWSPLR
ncbi:MAG TPA: hypothetical protein VNT75_12940 [Symbiobacteriaceae bacterium]|nr:hypothetical protein [Symbiobacteriaceae bacterium]